MMDQEVLSEFIAEAREHLETIEPSLLELEKNPDQLEILNDIFRPMHSLKGASGFLNLHKINHLAHRAENILDALRKGSLCNDDNIMDVILSATDSLRQMLDNLEDQGDEGDVDAEHLASQIDEYLAWGESGKKSREKPQESETGRVQRGGSAEKRKQTGQSYSLSISSPEHLSDFLEESREITSNLNTCLIELESGGASTGRLVQDAFRYFHNLKGNSGLIGHSELNAVTHEAETLLNRFRSSDSIPDGATIDVLLKVVDVLEDLLSLIDQEQGRVASMDVREILEELRSLGDPCVEARNMEDSVSEAQGLPGDQAVAEQSGPSRDDFDPEDLQAFTQTVEQQLETIGLALENLNHDESNSEYVDALYRSMISLKNACGYMGFEEVKVYAERTADLVDQGRRSGQGFGMLVPIMEQEAEILKDMLHRVMEGLGSSDGKDRPETPDGCTESSAEGTAEACGQAGGPPVGGPCDSLRPVEQPGSAREKAEPGAAQGEAPSQADAGQGNSTNGADTPGTSSSQVKSKAASTIRVDHEKLDHLMNLIGELIINRNRFALITRELESGREAAEIVQHLSESTDSMARISNDLQDTIMQVRMVPVRSVFSRFPRLVRDLSRKSGKKVELITEGEETELDKSVVEAIGDPLVHLIRNAVDHGLEKPEDRQAAGKARTGRIRLQASHEGNSVVIKVEDDGKGIDPESIRDKAVEKEIISREEVNKLEDREAIELIFAPGFSTSQAITDVSGRGVGMDVVKNNIKSLNGNVTVQSEAGRGSTFILSLPLTLAIIEALLVTVGGHTFAIPLDAVSETTKISSTQITEVNKRKAITLRGQVLGIIELSEVLGLSNSAAEREVLPLVIISVNEKRLGLVVDTLLHRQEIVIKSLGEYLGELRGISGATIMGDGSVIIILDPNEIFTMINVRG